MSREAFIENELHAGVLTTLSTVMLFTSIFNNRFESGGARTIETIAVALFTPCYFLCNGFFLSLTAEYDNKRDFGETRYQRTKLAVRRYLGPFATVYNQWVYGKDAYRFVLEQTGRLGFAYSIGFLVGAFSTPLMAAVLWARLYRTNERTARCMQIPNSVKLGCGAVSAIALGLMQFFFFGKQLLDFPKTLGLSDEAIRLGDSVGESVAYLGILTVVFLGQIGSLVALGDYTVNFFSYVPSEKYLQRTLTAKRIFSRFTLCVEFLSLAVSAYALARQFIFKSNAAYDHVTPAILALGLTYYGMKEYFYAVLKNDSLRTEIPDQSGARDGMLLASLSSVSSSP